MEARASKHAVKRMRQRLGLTKKAAEREMYRAMKAPMAEDCHGELRGYLDGMRDRFGTATIYRITPAAIYAFRENTLITVLKMPARHSKAALVIWEKTKRRP